MLDRTSLSATEIAAQLGFSEAKYFGTLFKKQVGVSPIAYRERNAMREEKTVKLEDKLWNWGHLEGSHDKCIGKPCFMTPEGFAEEYGVPNAFIVSYGGNIQPPFHDLAKRLSGLREIKWSVLGDALTPLPEDELGNTNDILDVLEVGGNITGGVVDDFFSPKRMERFTPEVLKKIRAALNKAGRDFWCVLYAHQLDMDLAPYLECFDGITFWIWKSEDIANNEAYLEKLFALAKDKPVMLGMYFWDYASNKEIPAELFERQLSTAVELLKEKRTQGIVFCSGAIGDAGLETQEILKRTIREQGQTEL